MDKQEAIELLADYAHDAWAGWMKYLFKQGEETSDGRFIINASSTQRWHRQCITPYQELPESEKASDRAEAEKILAILAKE